MAITRNATGGGNRISTPGQYRVKVHEMKTGNSKGGKPMLTVTFQTADEKQIAGYFVRTVNFHMHNLRTLKEAAGLKGDDPAEKLHGREVGILVEAQAPNEQGQVWMQIAGYGKADEVEREPHQQEQEPASDFEDSVPF